jgi:ketosteroid isomerase-like protein
MSKRIILWSGISAVFALACLWLFWTSEEDRIHDQFDELSALGSKTGDASPLSDALVLKEFGNLFSANVVFKTGGRTRLAGEYTDRELVERYGHIRVLAKRLELRFDEIEFLSIQDTEATVTVQVLAEGTDKGGNRSSENFRAEILLRKSEGDWKFSQFTYLDSFTSKHAPSIFRR